MHTIIYCEIMRMPIGYRLPNGKVVMYTWVNGKREIQR